jgi:hypothetical protein
MFDREYPPQDKIQLPRYLSVQEIAENALAKETDPKFITFLEEIIETEVLINKPPE